MNYIMNYNVGDFIKTNKSKNPALIICKNNNHLLVSIVEYEGDYIWVTISSANQDGLEIADLLSEEKLSILASFGDWYYEQHTLLFQEILIEALQ